MPGFVGVTDWDWFQFLKSQPGIDEVNFWQPSGNNVFRALPPGGLFLFKLHMPRNFIVGGGFFAYANLLPASLAWSAFERKNGAQTFGEMRSRIAHYRHAELGRADPTAERRAVRALRSATSLNAAGRAPAQTWPGRWHCVLATQ